MRRSLSRSRGRAPDVGDAREESLKPRRHAPHCVATVTTSFDAFIRHGEKRDRSICPEKWTCPVFCRRARRAQRGAATSRECSERSNFAERGRDERRTTQDKQRHRKYSRTPPTVRSLRSRLVVAPARSRLARPAGIARRGPAEKGRARSLTSEGATPSRERTERSNVARRTQRARRQMRDEEHPRKYSRTPPTVPLTSFAARRRAGARAHAPGPRRSRAAVCGSLGSVDTTEKNGTGPFAPRNGPVPFSFSAATLTRVVTAPGQRVRVDIRPRPRPGPQSQSRRRR
jgi:nitrate reductase cytochrome c-type subunit